MRPWRLCSTVLFVCLLCACQTSAPAAAPTSAPATPAPVGSSTSENPPTAGSVAPQPVASAALPSPVASPSTVPQPVTTGSGGQLTIRAAYVAPVAAMAPLWMAADSQAFARQNVSVSLQLIDANAAVAALLGRDIDVLEISGPAVLSAALHGAPLVFIGSGLNHSILSLVVPPSVQTVDDLKGKPLASDRPGTPVDFAMQASLSLLNVSPNDVELLPIGSADSQLAALESNQVYGAILGPPQSLHAEDAGDHSLQDTFGIPYQNVGLVVLRDRLPELTPALTGFLLGYRDGINTFNTQPDLAKEVLRKYSGETDQSIIDRTYDFHISQAPFQQDLQPTREGIQSMLTFLTGTIPEAAQATPDQFIDTRILATLPPQ